MTVLDVCRVAVDRADDRLVAVVLLAQAHPSFGNRAGPDRAGLKVDISKLDLVQGKQLPLYRPGSISEASVRLDVPQ